jgi:ribosomal protein S18 acetylase RimI-like enzyme
MDPVVREATLADARSIAEIHVATWKHAYRGIVPATLLASLSVEQRTKDWVTRLQPGTRQTYVLETAGEIRGWASIGPSRDDDHKGDYGELYAIYMAPDHIGRSLGQILYARCERELEKERYPFISVWVLEENAGARRFYEKVGFQLDGGTKVIALAGAKLPELRYAKKLCSS